MFDQEEWPGELAWLEERAATLDLIDELDMAEPAQVSDAEFATWAAELEGSPVTAAEVVAAAEAEPVTPATVARLAAIDAGELDDDGRIGLAVAWTRVRNYADAMVGDVVAVQVAATVPVGGPKDVVRMSSEDLTAAELSASLRVSQAAAADLVFVADMLARRLKETAAAVRSGAVSWTKASMLANATAALSLKHARAVEERVLPFAARRTPSQHAAAVRRWVDRVDPAGAEERRRQAREDVRVTIRHTGDGVGELFARMPAEELDTVWLGADTWARRRKEAGDPRTLDVLRVAALVTWATSFLTHGDPTYCDTTCDPGPTATDSDSTDEQPSDVQPGDEQPGDEQPGPPTRHGRPALVRLIWDLTSLLGVTAHCGELLDSGATLPPEAMRDLLAGGVRVRRLLIDPDSGELLDLSPRHWLLALAGGADVAGHPAPYELGLILDTDLHRALTTGDVSGLADDRRDLVRRAAEAIAAAPSEVRALVSALLAHPVTADDLDGAPEAYPPRADLAEFVGWRDRHPTNPAAGQSSASAGDQDHVVSARDGGLSVRDNLHSPARRWHRLRTHAGWLVERIGRAVRWTAPSGRVYLVNPYDFRLGP
ncbi:MAG TPA: DUF222 domain-containing protein [Mycobacteriales bacterium]|nr:DUF222 domain-containing protein [Mycobacteriales bacterium]